MGYRLVISVFVGWALISVETHGLFVFWYAGIAIGVYTIIIFIVVHYMFEKMFKLPKDARFKKR